MENNLPANVPAGMTMTPNVSLEEFEQAVYSRDYERAAGLLLTALQRFKAGAHFTNYPTNHPKLRVMLYSRFCAAVLAFLLDRSERTRLSQQGFECLVSEHATLDMLFRASVFETSDHMLALVSENPTEADRTKLKLTDKFMMSKFFTVYSLRSAFNMKFESALAQNPQNTFAFWVGACAHMLNMTKDAHEKREKLLELAHLFEGVKLSDTVLPSLTDAYMYCSYAVGPKKHDLKALTHRLFANLFRDHKVELPSLGQLRGRWTNALLCAMNEDPGEPYRPTMLVCVDWFNTKHAMYRCYLQLVRQLRTRFVLVGMGQAAATDEEAKKEFDRWVDVPPSNIVLRDIVKLADDVKPDVVWYPSVGMALWWVALASIRIAPMQFMTMGHPASSQSPVMDYVFCEEGSIACPESYTETIKTYPVGSAKFVMRKDAGDLPSVTTEIAPPKVVHVAVPAMLCKLNAVFMETLSEISKQSAVRGVKTHFHFFINMLGLTLFQTSREIEEWVKDGTVYERTDYASYMKHLSQCHLQLCTFPFGGTNSNVDSLLLGIPMVAMSGLDHHERYDAMMMRRAGLPEHLVAHTKDEYIKAAVELICDHDARWVIREDLMTKDLQAEFFGDPRPEHRGAFVDAVWDTFLQHNME